VAELDGKVALITGASRGIGKAIAQRFAAEGASVVLSASRLGAHGNLPGTLEEAVAEINAAGGKAAAVACELSDPEARASLVSRAQESFGAIDIMVNNAARSSMAVPSEVSTAQRNAMFDLNVNVPVELTQQVLPGMREKGAGWVLNISSRTAIQEPPPYPDSKMSNFIIGAYGASKAALERYTQALAQELVEDGLFINSLAPSCIVMTPGADYVKDIARRRPDLVEPVEMMAEAALELCTGRHVGKVVFSRDILHACARQLRGLDGRRVIGDAFTLADID
jgi:citronellol/citronellal dehydrogenase